LNQPSLIGRLVALIATATLIVLGLMFSAVLLVFIVTAGALGFAWLWWKTRTMRRLMREQQQRMAAEQSYGEVFKGNVYDGEIIEGEVIRKVISIEEIKR